MPKSKGKHLTLEDRETIEDGIRNGLGCREIAGLPGVAPSTISREVKQNRTRRLSPRRDFRPAQNCIHYAICLGMGSACEECVTYKTKCRDCKSRKCIEHCGRFELRTCPENPKLPFVCPPKCPQTTHCNYPRMRYSAPAADNAAAARLSSVRSCVAISPAQAAAMMEKVRALRAQGQSIEAIWAEHSDEMPACVRTCYCSTRFAVRARNRTPSAVDVICCMRQTIVPRLNVFD